jgi:hypothetical protein
MFRNVAEVQNAEPDLSLFRQVWQEIQYRLESPIIHESEIMELEIPDGQMFIPFRGYLNGRLVHGRLVRTREGNVMNVDHETNTQHLRELQRALEQRIGRVTMIGE